MWKEPDKSLGRVEPYKETKFRYAYTGNKVVDTITPSCSSCTKVKLKGDVLHVSFTTGAYPQHLRTNTDNLSFNYKITVLYKDGTNDVLTFNGVLIK